MKTRKSLACLLLALLLALTLAPAAFADMRFSGEEEALEGEVDATAFLAGANPVNNAEVKGLLFEAGNTVTAGGSCEYAFVAGNLVTFSGTALKDAFVGGNSVTFSGGCGRDLSIACNALELRGEVGRDLLAGAKTIVISGKVGGNVNLSAEQITITDGAEIGGTLRYNSSAKISAPAGLLASAEVYADKTNSETPAESSAPAPAKTSSPLNKLKSKLFSLCGLLLIGYFLLWLTPLWEKLDAAYTGKSFGAYAGAFGIGCAVILGLPTAAILLMISGVGLRPAFVLLLVYGAALIGAPVILGFFLGSLIWRKGLKKARNYWAELAIGVLVLTLASFIPYVSVLFAIVAMAVGLGVLARLFGKKRSAVPAVAVNG